MKKKILMVIAFKDFQDEEYFIPKMVFENEGFDVVTSSDKKGTALGYFGSTIEVDVLAKEADAKDYVAVFFAGGSGMAENLDNKDFHKLAKDFAKEKKIISAICIAPALLAKAGLLFGKKVVVYSSPKEKMGIEILSQKNVSYIEQKVVVDGNIITGQNVNSARVLSQEIVQVLQKK